MSIGPIRTRVRDATWNEGNSFEINWNKILHSPALANGGGQLGGRERWDRRQQKKKSECETEMAGTAALRWVHSRLISKGKGHFLGERIVGRLID